MSNTPRRLTRRPTRTVPATILSIALIILGGFGCWIVGSHYAGAELPPDIAASLEQAAGLRLDSTAFQTTAVVLALIGLILLICALWPGQPSRMGAFGSDVPGETAIARSDVARRLKMRVLRVDGVHSANVHVGSQRADVRVATVVDDSEQVRRAAEEAVTEALQELRPASELASRVTVKQIS